MPHPADAAPGAIEVIGASNGNLAVTSTGPSLDTTITLRAITEPTKVALALTPFGKDNEAFASTLKTATPTFTNGLANIGVIANLPFGGPFGH